MSRHIELQKAKQLYTQLGLTDHSVLLIFSPTLSVRSNTAFESRNEDTVKLLPFPPQRQRRHSDEWNCVLRHLAGVFLRDGSAMWRVAGTRRCIVGSRRRHGERLMPGLSCTCCVESLAQHTLGSLTQSRLASLFKNSPKEQRWMCHMVLPGGLVRNFVLNNEKGRTEHQRQWQNLMIIRIKRSHRYSCYPPVDWFLITLQLNRAVHVSSSDRIFIKNIKCVQKCHSVTLWDASVLYTSANNCQG